MIPECYFENLQPLKNGIFLKVSQRFEEIYKLYCIQHVKFISGKTNKHTTTTTTKPAQSTLS